ncbi:hypothetical protein [Pseudomonas typographi]|uniref:hypothetical protein n=1 Tax=Pseudomonas typographi TaxID=2715964 RepID=UPI001681F194|nr:hypothetical protein [Pseudomonas typographi]MBD1590201.1 hypothetical protein [Pseudomonas typographi]
MGRLIATFGAAICCCISLSAAGDQSRGIYKAPPNLVKKAQHSVAAKMRDPSSAQFRNVVAKGISSDPKKWSICGEVNGKNGFGGYAGFTRFAYDESLNDSWIEAGDAPDPMVRTLCGN